MGYYTDYKLTATWNGEGKPSEEKIRELEAEIKKMNVFESWCSQEEGWFVNAKWYEWDEDMSLLSQRMPEFLFLLEGYGEESDDIWAAYFLNGKAQYDVKEVIINPYDPEKMISCLCDEDAPTTYSREESKE